MPIIGSRGGASARGFGLFGGPFGPIFAAGTLALFEQGLVNAGLNRYVLTNDTCSATTALTGTSDTKCAAGNVNFAVFNHGSRLIANTFKFLYNSAAIVAGTALSSPTYRGASTGNDVRSLFAVGSAGGTGIGTPGVVSYRYADDAALGGTNLTGNVWFGSGFGTKTVGMFNLGNTTAGQQAGSLITNKYTYSSDAVALGTNLTTACGYGPATGNTNMAIIAVGGAGNAAHATTQRYTYAGDTTAPGTSLTANIGTANSGTAFSCGTGNAVNGILPTGSSNTTATCKYVYASNAVSVGGALSLPVSVGGAVANGNPGVSA